MLALRANRTVSADELIDGLYAERPPPSAAKNVQLHVSRLRKAFGSDDCGASIVTHGRGYELKVSEGAVDAVRFEQLVERARHEADQAIPDGAAQGALELWRGAPLADVANEPFAGPEIRRLEELRLRALELAIDGELAAGRHGELIGRLETLLAEDPFNERFYAQRMLALYRAGRQSEALEAYREAYRALTAQIGVEPGPELRRLQDQILAQDPALDAPAPRQELPPQLEGGSPLLAGRNRELGRLRERWEQAREGRPVCALVCGPAGIGKTRLVAELAGELQDAGAAVLYAGGGELADVALETVAAAGKSHRPTLLVLDYADDAPPAILEAAAALARAPAGQPLLICVLQHDEQGPPAFAGVLEAGAAHRLPLGPLGEDAASEIAALYAPEGVALPLKTLIAESDGVPLRIHRAAADWARAEAAERLAASAGRAADDRSELRATQAAIAGGVVDLHTAGERRRLYAVEEPPDPSEPVVCPFRGLASFDAAHAEYFFGRERLVAELVARLVGSTLLAVFGPSGSGKSSAIRAGLLPALADGVVPGSDGWRRAVMRPGERPLAELSRTLARAVPEAGNQNVPPWIGDTVDRLVPGERLVLLVDQFEEVFVACRDEAEREAFLEALVEAAADPDGRLVLVLAIRADFYGRCAEHADLSTVIGSNQVLVGPMRRDELRRAIELPARRAGLRVEAHLVSALIGDVAGEPGGLPLLSAALLELWQRRDGRTLTFRAYERTGGVDGAVTRLAEDAYQRLSEAEQARARPMLLRLAGDDQAAEAFVRRRVSVDELELEHDQDAARALAVLTESRLLTADEGTVEVAHEALLREWPRLRGWLEEDAEGRRLHHHLIGAAREWRDSQRDPAELYRGARLAAALDWAAEHDPELNELESEYLDQSRAASEREAERQLRTNRRLRTLLVGVGVLLAAAVVAGVIAISERHGARSAATSEAAQRLGAQALGEDRLDQALRLAGAGVALDDSLATRSSLLSVLLREPAVLGVLDSGDSRLFSLALSPDGGTVATGDENGIVTLFDTETRERIGEHQAPGLVPWMGFHPRDGSLAIVARDVTGNRASLQIIDAATARLRSSVSLGPHPADPRLAYIPFATYTQGGRSLVVAYTGDFEPTTPLFLRRFDARTGVPGGPAVRVASGTSLSGLSATTDGRLLYGGRETTYAIDEETLRVVRRYPVGGFRTGLSADGSTLAIGARDGSVRLLDLASGRVRALTGSHDGAVVSAVFSPNGHTLATGGTDGKVIVRDLSESRVIETLEGHRGDVWAQAFSPDGHRLYTGGIDSRAVIWDTGGSQRLGIPFRSNLNVVESEFFPPGFALSPDGSTLAVGRFDGRVDQIDAETLRRTGGFEAFRGRAVMTVEYSSDGRLLAVAGGGGGVGVWDADSGQRVGGLLRVPRGPVLDNPNNVQVLAFGNAGLLAAATTGGSGPASIYVWDLDSRRLIRRPLHLPPFVLGLAFSPYATQLAIAFGAKFDGRRDGVDIRSVPSGRRITTLPADDEVRSLAYSPDGRLLAGGQIDGSVLLWEAGGWRQVGAPLASSRGESLSVAFTADGRTLATSHDDGAVLLWDVESQQPIGSPLPGPVGHWVTARFTPDGRRLFAVYDNRHAFRWEIDPDAWERHACAVANGGLTPEQWTEIVPEQEYISACPSG